MSAHKDLGVKAVGAVRKLKPVSKAVGAGLTAGFAMLVFVASDGTTTGEEWGQVLTAAITAAGGAYFAPKNGSRNYPPTQ